MSRGFYSKHYVSTDRCFYYNPETGLSSWSPPVDGIVLEAPNAKKNLIGGAGASESQPATASNETAVTPFEESAQTMAVEASEGASRTGTTELLPTEASKGSAEPSTVDEFLSSAWQQVSRKKGG